MPVPLRSELPRFDSADPRVLDDPYPIYEELRAAGPLARGGTGQWVLSRHREVASLLPDPRLTTAYPEEYHVRSIGEGPAVSFFTRIVLDRDSHGHAVLRRLLHRGLSRRTVDALRPRIARTVDALLQPALDGEPFDVVTQLADPLPIAVICDLLKIPEGDREWVREQALDLSRGFGLVVSAEDRAPCHAAVAALRGYIGHLMDERTGAPEGDLLGELGRGARAQIRRADAVDNAVFLFFAGFETTRNLLANGVAALLEWPAEAVRLQAEPRLVPRAVEELLRYDAPIQATARMIMTPLEASGRTLRPGRLLVFLLGSANRDPEAFERPHELDLGRAPNHHVSFGGGVHACLGAQLARVEAGIVLGQLATRVTMLQPSGASARRRSSAFRSLASLPVMMRAG